MHCIATTAVLVHLAPSRELTGDDFDRLPAGSQRDQDLATSLTGTAFIPIDPVADDLDLREAYRLLDEEGGADR
jgi:hypothetical protein